MKQLIDGVRRFKDIIYPPMQPLFEELAEGQKPHTLFITCADSRIDPSLITQSTPGELFVHRNPGNLVPEFGSNSSGEAASIEYAVCVLGVTEIVICGHSQCGAMAGLANPASLDGLDHVVGWLEHAKDTQHDISRSETDPEDALLKLIGDNVVAQLGRLNGYPFVAERVASGKLNLHGWVYMIETGDVRFYQSSSNSFISRADLME